jgi:C_GCAxxG_C_C family probable redox protein
MLAVGEARLEPFEECYVRMSTGFGGGVARTREELCGALGAGVMLIGALHGRARIGEDEDTCLRLSTLYRTRFRDAFGETNCGALRRSGFGSDGHTPCSVLVERAAGILLGVLEEA